MATRKIEMVTVRWLRSTADAAKPFGHVWTRRQSTDYETSARNVWI